jgi:hypothetical protein
VKPTDIQELEEEITDTKKNNEFATNSMYNIRNLYSGIN